MVTVAAGQWDLSTRVRSEDRGIPAGNPHPVPPMRDAFLKWSATRSYSAPVPSRNVAMRVNQAVQPVS
jgi:hypothetical protein